MRALLFAGAVVLGAAGSGLGAEGARPYRCVFRVNTSISAGRESPEEIARKASARGIDVLVFTDQVLARAEWGAPGFRGLIKRSRENPSVMTYGPKEYLDRLAKVGAEHPAMVVIAGLDVAPYYYWEGLPLQKGFSVHQWSEQLTVIGLEDPEAIRRVPVAGNPNAPRRWTLGSAARLLPGLLIVLGVGYYRRKTVVFRDEQGSRVVLRDRAVVAAAGLLAAAGALGLASGYPWSQGIAWDQYRPTSGPEPYEEFLKWLGGRPGAMGFWSSPEISTSQEYGGVRFLTRPYLRHVGLAEGAAGFAGIYGDARSACKPGEFWDETLVDYCRGRRSKPLFIVGERDYHGAGELELIETVLILSRLDRRAVLEEGLAGGRMYARARGEAGWIEVQDFSVRDADGQGNGFLCPVQTDRAQVRVRAALRVEGRPASDEEVKVIVVRDGAVLAQESFRPAGATWETTWPDAGARGEASYYRLLVYSRGLGEILTNPVFVYRKKGSNR